MSGSGRKKHTALLLALAAGMFGFAFALVPLYNVFCEVTGLNGKTSAQATLLEEINASAAPQDREVTIDLLAMPARGLAWEFRPLTKKLVVRPGEMRRTSFYVRNHSANDVTAQAVPSISPGQAALYLKKIECFCFEQQHLAPGEEMEMGVTFIVDAKLPEEITEFTLSYTMFQVADMQHEQMLTRHE